MANGPPTPPPTSATELSDAARALIPSENAAISSQPPVTALPSRADIYQSAFPAIADLIAKGNYFSVIQLCERSDLNGDGDTSLSRFLVTAPLVLAYLIVDNLAPARYALSRLPGKLASYPLAKALRDLLCATRDRRHTVVYLQAESLYNHVKQTDFLDSKLGSAIASMTTMFIESFRQRTFTLLVKGYSSIPLTLARVYMGWSSEQLLTAASQSGWSYDEASQTLTPQPHPAASNACSSNASGPSSLQMFSLVAANVAHLEA